MQTIRREVDWAWLAGILDGEGNLTVGIQNHSVNGKEYIRAKIRITNTDARMIKKISEIYASENVVFFTSIHKQKQVEGRSRRTKMNIEVSSQGSVRKVLELVIPYLANKRECAREMLDLIKFVQTQPKGGNTLSIRYVEDPVFIRHFEAFKREFRWYLDPSETTRRAGVPISW